MSSRKRFDFSSSVFAHQVEYVLEYEVPGTLSKATVKFVLSDFYVNSDAIFQTFRVTFLKVSIHCGGRWESNMFFYFYSDVWLPRCD